jgi:hypothetical protein
MLGPLVFEARVGDQQLRSFAGTTENYFVLFLK